MILALIGAALAQEADEADREAALFGEAPAEDTTDLEIEERLLERDDTLTLGGRLYLRANAAVPEDADDDPLGATTLSSPNLIDLFTDARPNDRVRAYTQVRILHDPTVTEGATGSYGQALDPLDFLLDQAWIKADIAHRVFVTAGRQRVKWGAGRFWNPTDFMNQQRLDPLAVFDERTGMDLLKVHVPIGSAINLYTLANLDGATTLDKVGGALRAEVLVGLTEFSLSAAAREDDPLRLGMDISSGLGPLDVHVEAAAMYGETDPFWEGKLDWESFTFPTEVDRSGDWIVQAVAGAELSFKLGDKDSLTLGAEVFYNDAGTENVSLYPWLFMQGSYTPFYVGRLYGAAYAYLPGPGRWDDTTFTASVLNNFSDGSAAARLDGRHLALTWLELNAYAMAHLGSRGEFRYSYSQPAMDGVEGLEEGLEIPSPLVDLGLGARVRF